MQPQRQPSVSPERIMKMGWGYAVPLIIESAVHERVFDHLDKAGPQTMEQVSAATGTPQRSLRMIMNALVGFELLSKDSSGRFDLTEESRAFLVSGKPAFLGGLYKHISVQLLPKWAQLPEIVRTGKSAAAVNDRSEGAEFFANFVADIFPMSYPSATTLARSLNLSEAVEVRALDIAAGSGVWGIALAQASPRVRVTAVDWPQVLPVTRSITARHGVADRFEYIAGDILQADYGSGYQVATLGHILHSEGEERSRALLRKVFDALAPGGVIAIAEFLVNDERTGPPNGLIFAVNMLVNTDAGDTFSFNEIAGWLTEIGFTDPRTLDAPGPSPLILATKPAA